VTLLNSIGVNKLKEKLSKTRKILFDKISETITGKAVIDEEVLQKIEEILISSDIGYEITERIISSARSKLINKRNKNYETIRQGIKNELIEIVNQRQFDKNVFSNNSSTNILLFFGVNGTGKTTTIGKLAYQLNQKMNSVLIVAADTYRAAANDQLEMWAKKANVEIKKSSYNDPSAVVFDAIKNSTRNKIDYILIDTAGRLHNQKNLMEELKKLSIVVEKVSNGAQIEKYLVLDANAGQNSLAQAIEFSKFIDLTGLVINKLDGTAKGGIIFNIIDKLKVPIKYIGIGEDIEDLIIFDPFEFIDSIFSE
jgi:fused signal recognition particle receptor